MKGKVTSEQPRLLLIGGGHGHLAVLEAMRLHALPAQVTLVTPDPMLTYSGLLPAYLAGHVELAQCQIAVADYARSAGATVILDRLVSLDASRRCCELASGTRLSYDLLSLDTGSVTANLPGATLSSATVIPVRPLKALLSTEPGQRVVVVGGGAGGIELAFAYAHRGAQVSLVSGAELLPGHHRRVAKTTAQWLGRRGIALIPGRASVSRHGISVMAEDASVTELVADHVIVATGAYAPAWISDSHLRTSASGFVAVTACLQSQSHPQVFAIGDVSAPEHPAITRAGVHAVMAGPILADNLRSALSKPSQAQWSLKPYRPKPISLFLLATGPRHAILSWGPLVLSGRWLWWLKRWIDTRFVVRYRSSSL